MQVLTNNLSPIFIMNNNDRYFTNLFNNVHITSGRLSYFGTYTLYMLIRFNPNNIFDNIIASLTLSLKNMNDESIKVDSTKNIQKGFTFNLNQVTFLFKHTISNLEGVIARALGKNNTVAYTEFFPNGLTEYDNADRRKTDILVNRIYKLADKYSKLLPDDVVIELQAFKSNWENAFEIQGTTKAALRVQRTERQDSRKTLELILMQAIFSVGLQYPGDEVKCGNYFDFNLLYHVAHHHHDVQEGLLAVKEIKTIINRMMTDSVKIKINNTGTNANIIIWKGATETEPAPPGPITIKAGKSKLLVSSKIGDYKKPFLLIQNISEVNTAEYEVVIIG